MRIVINNKVIKIEFVERLRNNFIGEFDPAEQVIKILSSNKEKRSTLIHELTYAYLYYHGFADAPLNADLVCNFMEIFGERIIKEVNEILIKLEYS